VYAAVGGALAAGGIYGFLLWRKKQQLEAMITTVASGTSTSSALAQEAAAVRNRIKAHAEAEASRVARESAERYMGEIYGLTPQRIASIGALASRLGA
jgi:hypothetical protein